MIVLQFMFSGFWHFIGCLILICIIFEGIQELILAIRGIRNQEDEDEEVL